MGTANAYLPALPLFNHLVGKKKLSRKHKKSLNSCDPKIVISWHDGSIPENNQSYKSQPGFSNEIIAFSPFANIE